MSGRGPLPSISSHRSDDMEKLTLWMKNGPGSSKYKPPDYERLQGMVDAKRQEFDLIGQKVRRIQSAAKASKESSILQQHRQVWSRECPRLQKAEEKAESDLRDCLQQIIPTSATDTAVFTLKDYEVFLEREREAFRRATVEPVLQLREDLRFRLAQVRHQRRAVPSSEWEKILQQVEFVRVQQDRIIAQLHSERTALEEDTGLEKYIPRTSTELENAGSVPEEVSNSDCPYPELKESLIQAFHSLSERYQSRLHSLQEQLLKSDRFCGWDPDDHLCYQFTLSQYTQDVPKFRVLSMDMLQRLFPQTTKQQLLEHERELDWQRFTQLQLEVVAQQWHRDHEQLLARALVTLQDAASAHQEELEHHRDRQNQQGICSQLRDKLQRWRAQQEEVAKLEAAIAARQQAEEEARLKREQEKEATLRSQQKEKVRQFYLKQQRRREELEQRDQERLANLRSVMEEQAHRDKERVLFRADMLQRRQEEREAREQERRREEEERERRLEALRSQVAVVAEADPERLMGDTVASRMRLLNTEECELQRPLYSINTYTDTQILADPRVRMDQALREAGLHNNQYAQEIMANIAPPMQPRRDMKSTLDF